MKPQERDAIFSPVPAEKAAAEPSFVLVLSSSMASVQTTPITFSNDRSVPPVPMSSTMNNVLGAMVLHCSAQNASLATVVPATSTTPHFFSPTAHYQHTTHFSRMAAQSVEMEQGAFVSCG